MSWETCTIGQGSQPRPQRRLVDSSGDLVDAVIAGDEAAVTDEKAEASTLDLVVVTAEGAE
jgi:hypothetical protein